MISHEHRAIFFHIPKAAGSSVEKKLDPTSGGIRGWQDHRTVREVRPLSLWRHGQYLFDASRLRSEGLSRRRMSREMVGLDPGPQQYGPRATEREFETYLKFTVVRNPWDRVHSWYRNAMRDPHHGIPPCSFDAFLREHGHNWALRSQLFWITDFDGSIPLDVIARFETLAEDLSQVFRRLGFEDPSLPHLLKSGDSDYRSAYSDDGVRLVAERYPDEIERFGYSF